MTHTLRYITPDQLPALWDKVEPLLTKCFKRAGRGLMGAEDIRDRHEKGELFMFVEFTDAEPTLVVAVEFVQYPNVRAAMVLGLGGRDLRGGISRCWPSIVGWMKSNGATVVDALCSDAMARVLTRHSRFEKAYNHMRMEIKETS